MKIKINPPARVYRKHPDSVLPAYSTADSAGADVCIVEDASVKPGEVVLLNTGLVIQPPIGYYYELYLRSSTPMRKPGIVMANGVGIIDRDYCGPNDIIKVPVLNTSSETIRFKKGQRIAQLILKELIGATYKEVDQSPKELDRGGFGASG